MKSADGLYEKVGADGTLLKRATNLALKVQYSVLFFFMVSVGIPNPLAHTLHVFVWAPADFLFRFFKAKVDQNWHLILEDELIAIGTSFRGPYMAIAPWKGDFDLEFTIEKLLQYPCYALSLFVFLVCFFLNLFVFGQWPSLNVFVSDFIFNYSFDLL